MYGYLYRYLYRGHEFAPGRNLVMNSPEGESYSKMHYDIHQAINLTRMSCVLAEMEKQGTPKETIQQFKAMADCLLGLMATENNRNHGR